MFRLKSLLTFSVAASVAAAAIAQLSAADSTAAATYAVVGDVLSPDTYQGPAGSAVSLRDALTSAGMASATSHVLVIRCDGVQVHQRSEIVEAASVSTGSQLTPGDAVVVYAAGPIAGTIRPSVALIDGTRVCGLTLEGTQVAVGDLLAHCGVSRDRSGFVQLHSLVPGRRRTRVDLSEIVQHGDVVVVGGPHGAALADQTRFAPRVSEFRGASEHAGEGSGADPLFHAVSTSAPVAREPWLASSPPTAQLPLSGEASPAGHAVPAGLLMQRNERPDQAGEATGESTEAGVAATSVSLQSVPEELPPPAAPAPDLRNSGPQGSVDAREAAPVPPTEVSLVGDHATAYSLWNIIFVGGLLISGGLVAAGWLMSEAELRKHRLSAEVPSAEVPSAISRDSLTTEAPRVVSRDEHRVPEQPQKAVAAVSPNPDETDERPLAAAAGELVQQHEWYGTDWQTSVAQNPSLAGSSANRAEATVRRPEAGLNDSVGRVPGAAAVEFPTTAESFSDLTDLIRNRLPVDLCDASLPLRVSLFGQAAGPRRLRIDASHAHVAPPHFRAGSSDSSVRPAVVSAGTMSPPSVPSQASERPGVDGASPAVTRSSGGVRQSSESGTGSLDRALNFLNEQDA